MTTLSALGQRRRFRGLPGRYSAQSPCCCWYDVDGVTTFAMREPTLEEIYLDYYGEATP